ncbi:MAG: translesion DNA synthesis-associated protein ImuA [Methylibium sp.]|uniref:translesion DNA synthesis-associated protein ImuA n=1 Tax=Methylibium sp. TaxID=2067992 RepID=UPI00181F6FD6|nr:translesion DNA synthesis-associated protein ImuA [Methylibium sp.]MBA3598061.1 translesion DNA synthesis-associated protein ImuA [Methylibium sp.]
MLPSAALSSSAITRRQASVRALADLAPRLGLPLWQAGELAQAGTSTTPTAPTGWSALDAELPGGGWPLSGLTELLLPASASGELALLAPWLQAFERRELGPRELVWIAPPGLPCVAALQELRLSLPHLVCIDPASMADAAWAAEQALRSSSCAAVLWWNHGPVASLSLRRLHLAAQAGATPLMALRPANARVLSSPAPLRLSCTPDTDRRLAVEIFKRRGPPMAAPLALALPWPSSARPLSNKKLLSRHAVDRPASAAPAAASPALVATRV